MTTEVKAKLTLDDAASSTLARIKRGFGQANDASTKAQGAMGFFKQTLSGIASINFVPAIRGLAQFAMGFIEAAAGARDADQAIAGMITATQGLPWATAHTEAMRIGDEIDEIAMSIGQNINEVRGAFSDLLLFTGATSEGTAKATTQIKQLTTVANVLGMNTKTIAMEFGGMADGAIRTRGKMFQLLQTTGIFGDNVAKAASEWMKLTQEERVAKLAYGLDQVAGKMGKSVPTIHDLMNTISGMWNIMQERLAEPILDVLISELRMLIPELKEGAKGVEEFAKSMSKDVRRWVKEAAGEMRKAFQYLRTHGDEIRQAIVDGAETAKSVVEFILAHKAEIAVAFGVRAAAPVVSGAAGIASGVVKASATGGLGLAASSAGAAAALGAFALAIAGVTAALWQLEKLLDETSGGKELLDPGYADRRAREKAVEGFGRKDDFEGPTMDEIQHFKYMRAQLVASAKAAGENADALEAMADAAMKNRMAASASVREYRLAAAAMEHYQGSESGMEKFAMEQAAVLQSGFENAMKTGNQGAMAYIGSLIANNANLRNAFIHSATMTTEGFNTLASQVAAASEQFADQLKARGGAVATGAKTPKTGVHMSGGQTFNIKQDFRDQDPDRVAVVFERDVVRAAESRLAAVTSSPFGT
jgi:hypothetical protein